MSKMKNNINNLLRFGIVMIFSQIVMLIFLVYLTFSSGKFFICNCIVIVVVCLGVNIACYLKAKKMKKILDFINKSKIEYGKN
jgi:ABC-type siderophore export system fused ATPase/permease subunit